MSRQQSADPDALQETLDRRLRSDIGSASGGGGGVAECLLHRVPHHQETQQRPLQAGWSRSLWSDCLLELFFVSLHLISTRYP